MSWGLGTEREICWLDMLLVKGPLCSKERGTFCSKQNVEASFLHGTDREICWIHVLFYSKMKGTDREICSTDTLLVGASLFHGSEREMCWIVTLQKGTKREFCSTDMLWVKTSLLHGTEREILRELRALYILNRKERIGKSLQQICYELHGTDGEICSVEYICY
jgi:hypothetical protein